MHHFQNRWTFDLHHQLFIKLFCLPLLEMENEECTQLQIWKDNICKRFFCSFITMIVK